MLKALTYFCEDETAVGRQVLFLIKVHTYIAYFIYFAFWQTGARVREFIGFLEEHRERQ